MSKAFRFLKRKGALIDTKKRIEAPIYTFPDGSKIPLVRLLIEFVNEEYSEKVLMEKAINNGVYSLDRLRGYVVNHTCLSKGQIFHIKIPDIDRCREVEDKFMTPELFEKLMNNIDERMVFAILQDYFLGDPNNRKW